MVAARAGEQARVDLSARPACRLQGTIQARHARPQPGNGIRQCLTGGRDLPRWIGDAEDEQIVAAPPPTTPDVFDRLLASAAMLGDRSRLHVVEDAENRPEDIRSTIAPVLKTSGIHRRLQVKRGLRGAGAPVCAPVLRTAQDSRAGRARGWAARLCFEIVGMASR